MSSSADAVLSRLAQTIAGRRGADPSASHTARLLAKGPEKCAEKFGEEAVEAIIEAVKGDRERLVSESADVLYHLLVMLAARNVALDDVLAELVRREGTSGFAEKAARLEVARVTASADLEACLGVRAQVFIAEQKVPRELEVDGRDPDCAHYLARRGGVPLGAARVLRPGDGSAKIQRVAVLREGRGGGIGQALMRAILADIGAEPNDPLVWLESQVDAIPFYERLGFVAEGDVFMDAGIPHRKMVFRR